MPKLQDPDFIETSVSSDEGSESSVSSDSEVVENEEPAMEGENEKRRKILELGFMDSQGRDFSRNPRRIPKEIWLSTRLGQSQLTLLEKLPRDHQEALP